jgi:hypothetical protein
VSASRRQRPAIVRVLLDVLRARLGEVPYGDRE